MSKADNPLVSCLVWMPQSYNERGPAESCVRILEHFRDCGVASELFLLRERSKLPASIAVHTAAGPLLTNLPLKYSRAFLRRRLERKMARAIRDAVPGTIVWFWLDIPVALVRLAKERGLVVVREMINSPVETAKVLLDRAYAKLAMAPTHGLTSEVCKRQASELPLYDYIFASNPEVENALVEQGVERSRLLPSSFGWTPARFEADATPRRLDHGIRFVFVGSIIVRKGVHVLLDAWDRAEIDGELVLAGSLSSELHDRVEAAVRAGGVRHLGYVAKVADLYRSSDVFVFPTLEEGGPQVTYEAAGCGLPVITTPMGAARLVVDGDTGLLVPPDDVEALAQAMRRMAKDSAGRKRLAEAAQNRAADFTYDRVGRERARMLLKAGTGAQHLRER